ncbi:hypothetical protein OYC64_012840 [Pagothenia borchgrevinki]|uniref:Mixed lineage kinase domain-containing protein n=1 Tax=Pagothenia borchgrevinki TaxID=8213 RepID=A0ABD2FS95_PAGBO
MAALDPFMGVLDFSLNLCSSIYMRAANVSANKERCQQIAQRVKALEGLILTIKHRGRGQLSPVVDSVLRDLCGTLTSAKTLMEKFARTKVLMRLLKSSSHEDQLLNLDKRLSDTFQVLSGALLIEQGDTLNRVYNTVSGNTGPTTPMPQPNNMLMPSPTSPPPYSSMPPMALCYPEPPMTYSPMSPMNYSPMPPMTSSPMSPMNYNPMPPMTSSPMSPMNYSPMPPMTYSPMSPMNYSPMPPMTYSPMSPMATCYPEPPLNCSGQLLHIPPMATCNPTSFVIYSTMTPMSSVPFSTTFVSNPAKSTMVFNIK